MNNRQIDVLIANPGTHPEMMQFAAAVATEFSAVYATSSNFPANSAPMALARNLSFTFPRLSEQLLRRRLPVELQTSQVAYGGLAHEVGFQISKKLAPRQSKEILRRRNAAFGRRVQKLIAQTNPRAVVGQYTASLAAFNSTPEECIRLLNYPIAHHNWLQRTMRAEALSNPQWAPILQGHDFSRQETEKLDLEIDKADYILVPSSFAARTFEESGVAASKLITLELGCDPQRIAPRDRRASGPFLQVLYAGQVTQRKGIGYLVEAVSRLPQVRLTVIGECSPTARELLRKYSGIKVLPTLPRGRLLEEMARADVLALPSLAEGFGLVAIEAMSVGCPVLVSRATFADDLIEDGVNGFILPTVSADSIAQQLERIFMLTSTADLRETSARTAAHYSWSHYRNRVRSLTHSILNGGTGVGH